MSHFVKVCPYRTLRFNPCVCNPYNADFDGDEMNIHVPQTLMARAEAKILMNVKYNFSAPKDVAPLVVPLQDLLTSTYLLTNKDVFLDRNQIALFAAWMSDCKETITLPPPAIYKPQRLWTGKQVIFIFIFIFLNTVFCLLFCLLLCLLCAVFVCVCVCVFEFEFYGINSYFFLKIQNLKLKAQLKSK